LGRFGLVAVLASPEHVDLGDAILGLQIWAALVALGGGLLLVPRQTAPYAAAAVGVALATGVVLSVTAGPSRYEWLPLGFLAVSLSAGTVHYMRKQTHLRWKAAWDAIAEEEIARHLRRQTRKRRESAAAAAR